MACVKELVLKVHVPMVEMQNLRVGIELAAQNPSHLERGKPEATVLEQPREVQDAQAQVACVTTGLVSFTLHPKDAKGKSIFNGLAHFDHLINLARRSVPMGVDLTPSATLDVEYSSQQQRLINPRPIDYAMHEIAKQAHGEGAKQAMAKRKMDNLGYIRGASGFANDPERCRRLKNQLGLMMSVAAISKEEAMAKDAIASQETAKLIESAPAALRKLMDKDGELAKITMAEMSAIAFKHFKGTVLKGNKAAHMKELAALIESQPTALKLSVDVAPGSLPPTVQLAASGSPAVCATVDNMYETGDGIDDYLPVLEATVDDVHESGDDDDYVPVPKAPAASASRCDYECQGAEMTPAEISAGYCSGRRCKSKLHHFCFLAHAGVAGEGLDSGTRYCRACWAKQ